MRGIPDQAGDDDTFSLRQHPHKEGGIFQLILPPHLSPLPNGEKVDLRINLLRYKNWEGDSVVAYEQLTDTKAISIGELLDVKNSLVFRFMSPQRWIHKPYQ